MTKSLFKAPNDMNIVSDQILETIPNNVNKCYVPYTNNLSPLWETNFDQVQVNFDYSPFAAMYFVMREYADEFYDMVNGHMIYNQEDYDEKRQKFNELFTKILNGSGNGFKAGYCSEEEMIRLGTMFFVILQTSDWKQGLVVDEQRQYKADWCKESKDVTIDWQDIKERSKHLNNYFFSDCEWEEFFYKFIPNTKSGDFWFIKMPDFLSTSYVNKKQQVDFNWIDQPSFMTFTKFVEAVSDRGGKAAIYYNSTAKFNRKIKDMLNLEKNLQGDYQNANTYLFEDKLDYDFEIISNYDINKLGG